MATDSTNAQASADPVIVNVSNIAVCFNMDVDVVAKGTGPQTTAAFSTGMGSELLLAFVGSDGPASGAQTTTVTGAGLTWTLVSSGPTPRPATPRSGRPRPPAPWPGVKVTATPSVKGYHMYLNVVAMQGTGGIGASAKASAATGAPHVAVTTTQPQSLIFGVGNDWDSATARTPGANQLLLNQWLDTVTGDTYWTQQYTAQTGAGRLQHHAQRHRAHHRPVELRRGGGPGRQHVELHALTRPAGDPGGGAPAGPFGQLVARTTIVE